MHGFLKLRDGPVISSGAHIFSKIKKNQNRIQKLWSIGCVYIEKKKKTQPLQHVHTNALQYNDTIHKTVTGFSFS